MTRPRHMAVGAGSAPDGPDPTPTGRTRVHVGSPRASGLLQGNARDWCGHKARPGLRVGRAALDTTERQLGTCEWDRAVARYLTFNGRRSGARLAPTVLTPHRPRGTDRGRL